MDETKVFWSYEEGRRIRKLEKKEISLSELYDRFEQAIALAGTTKHVWGERSSPYLYKALETLWKFAKGEATTPDVKYHFATLSTLGLEVVMTEKEEWAVLCVTEVCHAAAHLGHLAVAMNRKGKPQDEYASLQRAYVMFGLNGARRYFDKVNS